MEVVVIGNILNTVSVKETSGAVADKELSDAKAVKELMAAKEMIPKIVDWLTQKELSEIKADKIGPDSYAITEVAVKCFATLEIFKDKEIIKTYQITPKTEPEKLKRDHFLLCLQSDAEIEKSLWDRMEEEALEPQRSAESRQSEDTLLFFQYISKEKPVATESELFKRAVNDGEINPDDFTEKQLKDYINSFLNKTLEEYQELLPLMLIHAKLEASSPYCKKFIQTKIDHQKQAIKNNMDRPAHLKSLLAGQIDKLAIRLHKLIINTRRERRQKKRDLEYMTSLHEMTFSITVSDGKRDVKVSGKFPL